MKSWLKFPQQSQGEGGDGSSRASGGNTGTTPLPPSSTGLPSFPNKAAWSSVLAKMDPMTLFENNNSMNSMETPSSMGGSSNGNNISSEVTSAMESFFTHLQTDLEVSQVIFWK